MSRLIFYVTCDIYFEIEYNNWFLYSYILKCNLFLWWQSGIYSITPVFSVTWSFRNHSNILIWCSRHKHSSSYIYYSWDFIHGIPSMVHNRTTVRKLESNFSRV